MKNIAIVRVNPRTECGKALMSEFHPRLQKGMLIVGRKHGKAIDFKWHGNDAVLWVGDNCTIIKK